MLLKYIGLILLQKQEHYSILAVNTLSIIYDLITYYFLRCGYKYNTIIAFRSGRITEYFPKCCPYCSRDDLSFIH